MLLNKKYLYCCIITLLQSERRTSLFRCKTRVNSDADWHMNTSMLSQSRVDILSNRLINGLSQIGIQFSILPHYHKLFIAKHSQSIGQNKRIFVSAIPHKFGRPNIILQKYFRHENGHDLRFTFTMKWLSCRKYFLLLSTLVLISILTTFWSYISVSVHVLSDKNTIEEINYSPEDIDRLQNIPSLLTNSTCYIPDLPLWDEQVELALGSSDHSKDPECWRGGHNWSYVDHFTDELVFNLDVITNNGYDWDGLRCEYRVIKRISETQIE